jgi:hypothetical protein
MLGLVVCFLVLFVAGIPMSLSFAMPGDLSMQGENEDRPELPSGGFTLMIRRHNAYVFDEFCYGTGGFAGEEWPVDVVPRTDIMLIQSLLPGYRIPKISDLFRVDSGQPVECADRFLQFNVKGVTIYPRGENLEADFHMGDAPSQFPVDYKVSFDLRTAYRVNDRCGLCRALQQWLSPAPAFAQGADRFAGLGFQEDVALFARLEGPGRVTLRARTRTGERAVPGMVSVEGKHVEIVVRWAALNELGVAQAAIRVVTGVVGGGMFDRVPSQGSIQIGAARGAQLRVVARFDFDGDGRADILYYDTNGNGTIDAAARDTDRNGQIDFLRGEGPFAYVASDGTLQEFGANVEQRTDGNRRVFLLQNAQLAHVTIFDDKNGNNLIDEGEFTGYYLPKR